MARPLRIEFPGAIWHLTNRGVNRGDIFFADADREAFLELLATVVGVYRWIVHAYVQMTNHDHLVVETPETNLSRGMKDLDGDFAQLINARHGRVGHLFQGRFAGVLVERESHLLELLRYVVLNPVRAGMVDGPGGWRWSSYAATAGLAARPAWLEVDWTLAQFHPGSREAGRRDYREFVAAGVGMTRSVWEDLRCGFYLGTLEFGERLGRLVGERASGREYPLRHRCPGRPELAEIERAVCEEFGIRAEAMRHGRGGVERTAFATVARDRGGLRLRVIGQVLGVCDARVSRLVRAGRELETIGWGASPVDRIESRIEENRRARRRAEKGAKVKGKT